MQKITYDFKKIERNGVTDKTYPFEIQISYRNQKVKIEKNCWDSWETRSWRRRARKITKIVSFIGLNSNVKNVRPRLPISIKMAETERNSWKIKKIKTCASNQRLVT